ncbi:uncharacterized protein K460DRAFT_273747 [Cucurbitaria berberidis CBS 394.84]|uniref:Rhodopsin domain-containing protein n=1 Tax=Cucurbitaria berberidis CBS 394.84 TaxID=1168544 RepID=A0A9P4GRN9_9PLEO|nr:uncharacterized protein K460DRAFT_273747 [Cucurbitaria berberidis CBS 394.84]KAF1850577.1 hypothetical protein K460DRAFT_273747 [Cucurbitaria berberidis CBS 394.84]
MDRAGTERIAKSTPGGFVLVSTYSWLCITLGVGIARFGQSLVHKVAFGPDDATVLVGSIVYLGAAVSWQYAVNAGLGKATLSIDEVEHLAKAMYAAVLLGFVAMTFAKLSSAFLVGRVVPQTRKAKAILFGMIATWGIFSIGSVGFECGLPKWTIESRQCGNGPFLVSVIVYNIVTDLVLAGWIVPTLWSVSLNKEKCISATLLFGARAIVPLAAGAQIWAVLKANQSSNPGRDTVEAAVLTQAVTSLSLIVTSIPRIKRFLGVGGSGILYPQIQATELSQSRQSWSHQESSATEPKLVPSGSGKFTVTVTSKGSKDRKKAKAQSDWQELVTMGSREDEHTSTSSLFDRNDHGGVMMQQEVRVSVEERDAPRQRGANRSG